MTTARFSQVLAKSGTPHVHLTWTTPTRDKTLRAAVEHCRLLTVHQNARGQKKDFGLVGLHPGKSVQYLVFPKSLRAFAGKRVVGIDYAAVAEDSLTPVAKSSITPRPHAKPAEGRDVSPRRPSTAAPSGDRTRGPLPKPSRPETAGFPTPSRKASLPKADIVAFSSPPPSPAPAKASPWRDAVRQAAADLKRGKTIAAYDRLQRLLASEM